MIADDQTNFLYLADTLAINYPDFFKNFERLLLSNNIKLGFLPNTKDIWAVDYMPIQIDLNRFIRFTYQPTYFITEQDFNSKSDTDLICEKIGINTLKSDIIFDGGNITHYKNQVIITEQIFKDNPTYDRKKILNNISELLEVEHLYLIPRQPYDFTGHSDGMVRFLDNTTLLINDYKNESTRFQKTFELAIRKTGLDYIKVPYNPYDNRSADEATGDYINFLQMEDIVFLPIFNKKEDEDVVKLFEKVFNRSTLVTINANDIAKEGGVLNCISWNIKI